MNTRRFWGLSIVFAACAPTLNRSAVIPTEFVARDARMDTNTSRTRMTASAAGVRTTPSHRPDTATLDLVYEGVAASCIGSILEFPRATASLAPESPSNAKAWAVRILLDEICAHTLALPPPPSQGTDAGPPTDATDAGPPTDATDAGPPTVALSDLALLRGITESTTNTTGRLGVSLAPLAINRDVLVQLIQQRVRQAELMALQEILRTGTTESFRNAPVPLVLLDIVDSLAALLAPSTQSAVSAERAARDVLKLGLVWSLASALANAPGNGCDTVTTSSQAFRCLNLCTDQSPSQLCESTAATILDAVHVVRNLARGTLRRADLVTMLRSVDALIEASFERPSTHDASRAKQLMLSFTAAVRNGIREDGSTHQVQIILDVPAIVSSMLATYSDMRNEGWYLRATVGTGYMYTTRADRLEPTLYEEVGVGYRWPIRDRRFSWGWHVVTSGLLHQLVTPSYGAGAVFVGPGLSLNVYRLIDISANVGATFDTTRDLHPNFAFTIGLQLPLIDYIEALASGSDTPQVTSTSPR